MIVCKNCTTLTQLYITFHCAFFLSRLILTELESQERSYVESMRILVHDYLEPLEQAGPRVSSCELVFFILFSLPVKKGQKRHQISSENDTQTRPLHSYLFRYIRIYLDVSDDSASRS